MNKMLLIIITILLPITIISFHKKETNFIMEKNINVVYNNEVINIPIDEYIIGVVAGEMPASFEEEALKAQAVSARTYLMNKYKGEITATINDQVYISIEDMKEKWKEDYDYYYNKVKKAVYSTNKEIITYNGNPIKAYYYSMSNGYTESSLNVFNNSEEYLIVKESNWDKDNEQTIEITKNDFCNKLDIVCNSIVINSIEKDESNRIKNIIINNKLFTGIEIRKILNLRSTDFEIYEQDNIIKIKTKGYGHGVGMSQYGANEMAKCGYNYKEILNYYYENTKIEEI